MRRVLRVQCVINTVELVAVKVCNVYLTTRLTSDVQQLEILLLITGIIIHHGLLRPKYNKYFLPTTEDNFIFSSNRYIISS